MSEYRVPSFPFRYEVCKGRKKGHFFFPQRNSILETLYPSHLAETFLDVKCIDPLESIARKGQMFSS